MVTVICIRICIIIIISMITSSSSSSSSSSCCCCSCSCSCSCSSRSMIISDKYYYKPMKSEPPTPTRAPDSQFRKMQYQLDSIRNTSLLSLWGWGRGFLFHRWHETVGVQQSQTPNHSKQTTSDVRHKRRQPDGDRLGLWV